MFYPTMSLAFAVVIVTPVLEGFFYKETDCKILLARSKGLEIASLSRLNSQKRRYHRSIIIMDVHAGKEGHAYLSIET